MNPAALLVLAALAVAPRPTAGPVDFRKQIYPLLHDHCFRCHQGGDAKSGVRLDLRAELLPLTRTPKGRRDPLLVHLVSGGDLDRVMPPKGTRLTAAEVTLLRDWIEQGVTWDDALLPPDEKKAAHWAFNPVSRSTPPAGDGRWPRNPVDAFVAAAHRTKGLSPAAVSDRRTLVRRLSLDLTGLPPTPEEVAAFITDPRPDAYERVVERLLASPHHGERWGRHWLDVARYADSEGYESDHVRPYAWRYRDWVVNAFNHDKPFDRFVLEQLAGDELTPRRDEDLIATGFLAAARLSGNEEDKARQLNDVYVDVVNAAGSAFLGLTVQCAQCHDHKFDPIAHEDYYRLQGFFLSGLPYNFALGDPDGRRRYEAAKPPEYDDARRLLNRLLDAARSCLDEKVRRSLPAARAAALETPSDRRTPEQHALACEAGLKFQYTLAQMENAIPAEDRPLYAELKKKVAAVEAKLPDPPQTFGFHSPVSSPHRIDALPMKGFYPPKFDPVELGRAKPFVLLAGDAWRRGEALTAGWPAAFGPTPAAVAAKPTRAALARWLTDPANPLTARVWVNRVWQNHFGRGLVETPSDFGLRGARPSHPELLDWLARESIASGSTKRLHRLIVTSAAYRQGARAEPVSAKLDPDNAFLSRWNPRRLEAEAVRDAMLAVGGNLTLTLGGAPDADEDRSPRRGLYLLMKRQNPPRGLTLFDGPTAATESCPKRLTTTTPLTALFFLHNPFTAAQAKAFAERVRKAEPDGRTRQAELAFRLALGRTPREAERVALAAFFRDTPETANPLAELCHALMAANEFTRLE